MSQANNPSAIIGTERVFSVRTEGYLQRSSNRINSRWWGPKDFTNTFEQFEFKPGGRWVFVMHGPNGTNYPNESDFREIRRMTFAYVMNKIAPGGGTIAAALAERVKDIVNRQATCSTGFPSSSRRCG